MGKWFFFLYSFVIIILYLLALPFIFLFSFKAKYKEALPSRFFLKNNASFSSAGVWFHVCSFGEARAIKPLVEIVPKEHLRMSTITQTGYDMIGSYTQERAYLPFEPLLFGWVVSQKVLVVMEAELWYLLFVLAQKRGAKTLLVNARISDKSYVKYMRMRWFYRHIFKHIDEVYAQTERDRVRLKSLGAHRVRVTGNIKLSDIASVSKKLVKPSSVVVCAASTHEGEEQLVLDSFEIFKKKNNEAKLVMVPRHPERFEKVAKLIESFSDKNGVSWHAYSQKRDFKSDVILVDMLGELVNIYAISDIVILGGAFVPVGGHNAAEAAQFGCKMISGKYYFNQKDIFDAIEGMVIIEASNLTRTLLQHDKLRPTQIKNKTDISPIIASIKDAIIA